MASPAAATSSYSASSATARAASSASAVAVAVAATPHQQVSYEKFAPRSTEQVARFSRLAALTAGPTALAATATTTKGGNKSSSSDVAQNKQQQQQFQQNFFMTAMCPPIEEEDDLRALDVPPETQVKRALRQAVSQSDALARQLKHATSLRLALRASINIAEDVSNRHADLIRHSGELSAAADRLQEEEEMLTRHAEEIGSKRSFCFNSVAFVSLLCCGRFDEYRPIGQRRVPLLL